MTIEPRAVVRPFDERAPITQCVKFAPTRPARRSIAVSPSTVDLPGKADFRLPRREGFANCTVDQRGRSARSFKAVFQPTCKHPADQWRFDMVAGRHFWRAQIASAAMQALSSSAAPEPAVTLSPRERQVLNRVVRGRTSARIAEWLHLSVETVETYRPRLMRKLGVGDITGLMRLASNEGMPDTGNG
ncbi:helix-turn-helix transcriptional regulator [Burkholderia oklahomensis]|uniref:helix-turn-helix transcriptional regulator n=1 Tax=Burkholderia oklahomensis TaxID=342113 RepID=UPI001E49F1D9|nr:LuxR C-terminal-related transcriptional regulator [Burkholderia oklahomensis]